MMEPTQEFIRSIVKKHFEVGDEEVGLVKMQFYFEDTDFKEKFVVLTQELETYNLLCTLEKEGYRHMVVVSKMQKQKKRRWLSKSWTPRIMFAATVVMVLIDGFYRTQGLNMFTPIGDPLAVAVLYAWALIGILGVHEAGHLIAAKWHKIKTTWPYFIPGVPVYGIPTFGAFIQSRSLTVNRDILFDIAIAGPIAGLAVAVIVVIFGAWTSPVIDADMARQMFGTAQLTPMNENIIIKASLALFDKNGSDVEVIMGVLVLLNYWMMAIFILILSSRSKDARPLDDISPLSKNRKIVYIGVIILAILCAPIPSSVWP